MSEETELEKILASERKASELAKIIMVKKGTENDDLSDLNKEEIAHLTILSAVQSKINSNFLGEFIDKFLRYRKSLSRKSKKELVDMFKSLKDEEPSRVQQFRDLLGVG